MTKKGKAKPDLTEVRVFLGGMPERESEIVAKRRPRLNHVCWTCKRARRFIMTDGLGDKTPCFKPCYRFIDGKSCEWLRHVEAVR